MSPSRSLAVPGRFSRWRRGWTSVLAALLLTSLLTNAPALAATDPCVSTDRCSFYLANSWNATRADSAFVFGGGRGDPLVGDWDGNGTDTGGLRNGNVFLLAGSNGYQAKRTTVVYGNAGDEVLVGDWDGNGTDTLAVRRGNVFYLRNSVSSGVADKVFRYGNAGDEVLVGDWDGNGTDTLAVRRGNVFYIRNSVTSGVADRVFAYGKPGDEALVGDWNGDRVDTIAVRRGNVWYMRNDLKSGQAHKTVLYGKVGDRALVGDWDGNRTSSPGVYRPGRTAATSGSGSAGSGTSTPGTPAQPQPSASTSTPTATWRGRTFHAGEIISDREFFASGTMSAEQIRSFLQSVNPSCTPGADGAACLKDYTTTTSAMDTAYCQAYAAGANEDAATIISKSARACGINEKVLITLLQKEQGLVTASGTALNQTRYTKAAGYRCPDSAECDPTYAGLAAQVYYAASRYVEYGERPQAFRFQAGGTYDIAYSTTASCGTVKVRLANRATAALYNYTPYVPNAAALAHITSTGDSCSSYGNRNFWRNYVTWFGSTGV